VVDVTVISYRSYGTDGPGVIVLHGGPAAAGSACALAKGLSGKFKSIEPWQRRSGDQPLSVQRHIDDLEELVGTFQADVKPALVGESWGAMLGLAYAAQYPDTISCLALVGCGTFDVNTRAQLRKTIQTRTSPELEATLVQLSTDDAPPPFDKIGFRQTWDDMIRLQEEGIYPSTFSEIDVLVLMLHGDYDPHPGQMIRDSLLPHIPHLEYIELAKCGHSPCLEKQARAEFFHRLIDWLGLHLPATPDTNTSLT